MFEVLSGCNVIGHGIFGSMASNSEPPQSPNYDNIEMEGIGSLTLPNSLKAPFEKFELSGDSAQTTTKGLQLLDKTKIPTPQAGVAYYNMQVEEGKYTLSTKCRRAVQKDLFLFAGEVDTGASSDINGVDSTISRTVESINGYITIGYRKDENGVNPFDFETMLNKGDTPLPYEPYTGGKPSPSVEYPQEIVSAGKYDEVSGKYVIDVSVTGKNLFDISQYDKYDDTWTNTTYTTKKLKLKPNTTYTMSCKRLVDKPKQYVIFNILSGIKTGKAISVQIKPSLQLNYFTGKGTFTTGETGEIVLNYYVDCPKDQYWFTEVIGDIQIELGSVQTDYEPYHEPQTVQLQLDEPLRGIGEYKDVITKDGVMRRIKEIVLDESTGFETYWATLNKTFAFISPIIKDATIINGTPNRLLCNRSVVLSSGLDFTDEEVCVLFNRRFHMRFLKERNIDTVEKLKEWLKQNPIKIQYLLQEPVTEQFENSLENLHANNGTTVISVDSGEVETGIKLTYRKEK